ncbi:MAG: LysR family transcriptional regulator [Chloroflexi bacterium]|nr:LysR family transcriptional regulator [Chloroflexota bacterium]
MITLHQLEVFVAVAERRHFSQAAAALHLTQPAVTFQIRGLERALGVRLFDTERRRVRLTEAGEMLYFRAIGILNDVVAAQAELADYVHLRSGRLRLGATRTIGGYVLPELLAAFHRLHPGVQLTVTIDNTEQIEQMLLAHSLDLALVEWRVRSPLLHVASFRRDELVVAVPADDPLARMDLVNPADLQGRAYIARESGSGTRAFTEEALGEIAATLRVVLELDNPEAIVRSVEAGLGLAILSATIVGRSAAAGRLHVLRLAGRPLVRDFCLAYLRSRGLSPAGVAFTQFLTTPDGV